MSARLVDQIISQNWTPIYGHERLCGLHFGKTLSFMFSIGPMELIAIAHNHIGFQPEEHRYYITHRGNEYPITAEDYERLKKYSEGTNP